MSSLICILQDLNWSAPNIHEWSDPDGQSFPVDLLSPLIGAELLSQLHATQESKLWSTAAGHQGGQGLEHGGDLSVAKRFLKSLRDSKDDCRAALCVVQGSLPSSSNGCLDSCPFCGSTPTLQHLLYECEHLNATAGAPPAEWVNAAKDPKQQCFWLRGIIPSAWTSLRESVRDALNGHSEVGGLWAQSELLDGSLFYFGADASGGSQQRDPRIRICSWGISAVSLNSEGQWECIAHRGGILPGKKQTVPRAELFAITQLIKHTSGAMSFCSDSQLNMKLFRKLVAKRRVKSSWSNADLWLHVQEGLSDRWLRGSWVRSHRSQPEFELEFGSDLRWAYTANEHADRTAGKVSKWLDARHNLRTWGDIFRTSDDRCWKVLRFLTTRAKLLLQAPRRPKTFGPRVATGAEFLAHLSQLHPQHSWQHFPGAVFSRCTLHGSRRGRGLALLPCCRLMQAHVISIMPPKHRPTTPAPSVHKAKRKRNVFLGL